MEVFGFSDYEPQGRRLAASLGVPYREIDIHAFPDGESRVQLPVPLPQHIILCRSLDRPNSKLIELLLTCRTARKEGAHRITLVAPYLCYMRQDQSFEAGQAVSQHIVGELLADLVDDLITVDPHLHRTPRLVQAVPARHAVGLSATPLLGTFLRDQLRNPLLLGPDSESEQWVSAVARHAGLEHAVAHKIRYDDNTVRITLPAANLRGREVVLVDDLISTGHTIAEAAALAHAEGAASVHCAVTHALFTQGAYVRLRKAGIAHIWSTDSISHESNVVHLAHLLGTAVQELPVAPG